MICVCSDLQWQIAASLPFFTAPFANKALQTNGMHNALSFYSKSQAPTVSLYRIRVECKAFSHCIARSFASWTSDVVTMLAAAVVVLAAATIAQRLLLLLLQFLRSFPLHALSSSFGAMHIQQRSMNVLCVIRVACVVLVVNRFSYKQNCCRYGSNEHRVPFARSTQTKHLLRNSNLYAVINSIVWTICFTFWSLALY